jgi:hypothetical protein
VSPETGYTQKVPAHSGSYTSAGDQSDVRERAAPAGPAAAEVLGDIGDDGLKLDRDDPDGASLRWGARAKSRSDTAALASHNRMTLTPVQIGESWDGGREPHGSSCSPTP